MTLVVPSDRHYESNHHLWVQHDDQARIGIDSIGLRSLGELAYVSLRDVGTRVQKGESLGSLEAAKMTTNIVAPISGTITARNDAVLQSPAVVNDAPYGDGWLVEIEPTDWAAEQGALLSGAAVAEWAAAAIEKLEAESAG